MEKIKLFLQNKRNLAIAIACAFLLLATVVLACIFLSGMPASEPVVAVSSEPASSEPESSAPTSSTISIPAIPSQASSAPSSEPVSSEETVSSGPDLTVDAPSSKPEPVASKPAASSAPAKPVDVTPAPSSEPEPEPSVSSEPEASSEPVEIPYNPDGPQHGDHYYSSEYNRDYYYHVGIGEYLFEHDFLCCHYGDHPEATSLIGGLNGWVDEWMSHGDKCPEKGWIYCKVCKWWIAEPGWYMHEDGNVSSH